MDTINLEPEQESLEMDIQRLESEIFPLQEELKEKRERLFHIKALRTPKNESPAIPVSTKLKMTWADLCRKYNVKIGGDSAHRAFRRHFPEIHATIPHSCNYDNKIYL